MQGFDELPRNVQIRRVRRLAEIALTAYDLEVVRITPLPDFPTLRAAFLRGYREVQQLSLELEKYIEIFMAARIMGHTLWLAAHIGEPAFGAKAAVRVTNQVGELRDFL